MDWSNEEYVKLYTRETDDDLVLSWDARCVWRAMLTKFDRSGLIAMKRGRLGLAALIRAPLEVVERAIPELVADGRVQELGIGYFAPNFMDAQEATKSDKLRQRESRERRRAKSADLGSGVTKRDADVTKRDGLSRDRGAAERNVTLCSADPDPLLSAAEPPVRTEEPSPSQAPVYPKTQIHNPRTKLNFDVWQYAALEHVRLCGEGLSGSMPWPAMPAGAPMNDLVDRVRECIDQCGGDISAAAEILRRRVAVAVAEAQREQHLRWFSPSQLWDAKRFYRAIEIDPADAAKPRKPATSAPAPEPTRRVKTF